MNRLQVTSRVPDALAAQYRAEGWWDDRRLADGLEASARWKPDVLAVADNEHELTYAELVERVNRAIVDLAKRDVGTNTGVVLVTGNTVDAVVAYHALLRVGATVVALDRRSGASDVHLALEMLGDAALVVLPSSEHDRLAVEIGDHPFVFLEALADTDQHSNARWIEARPRRAAGDPLHVGYDEPAEGCRALPQHGDRGIEQHGPHHGSRRARRPLPREPGHEQCGHHPDAPVRRPARRARARGPLRARLVARGLERGRRDAAGGAPVIAERLLRAAEASPQRRITLRALALGGAMLPRPLLEQATDEFGIEIARVYGSSEASCATGSVPEDDREHRLADDGVLMPGTEVRIGSANSPQEGLLRGPCVMLGYVDPDDDAAAFEDGGSEPEIWSRSTVDGSRWSDG